VRKVPLIAAGAAIVMMAAACGDSSSDSASSDPNAVAKQITLWTPPDNFWKYQTDNLAAFTAKTGIKVNVVAIPEANILDKLTIAQRAKSKEFALYEGPTSLISQYVSLLGGVPLQPMVDNKTLTDSTFNLSDFNELPSCSLNGKLYCLPQFVDGAILGYNTKLFKQAGIAAPPQSWAEVLADAQILKQKDTKTAAFCSRGSKAGAAIATAHFMEAYYLPYNAANKGFNVDPNWKSLSDSPDAIRFATDYQTLLTKYAPRGVAAYTQQNCKDDFDQGKVAMFYDGITTFDQAEFKPAASSPIADSIAYTVPKCPTADPCMPLGPWGMFINPNVSKGEQNATWKLMQYLSAPDFMTKEIADRLQPALAVLKSVAAKPVAGVPQSYLDSLNYVAGQAQPNAFPPTTVFNQAQQNEETAISELATGTDPAKAMKFAADGMNQVFKQAGLQK
jgi:ABC-type glycerol-3-phosphate transport system substrate-binding protein